MAKYGYAAYTFRIHKVRGGPLPLGSYRPKRGMR